MWKKKVVVYCKEDGIDYFVKADGDLYHKKDGFHDCAKKEGSFCYCVKKECVYAVQLEH